jgi:hypothetical protein
MNNSLSCLILLTPVYLKYWVFCLVTRSHIFVSILIAVLIHELAHAYVAKKM